MSLLPYFLHILKGTCSDLLCGHMLQNCSNHKALSSSVPRCLEDMGWHTHLPNR